MKKRVNTKASGKANIAKRTAVAVSQVKVSTQATPVQLAIKKSRIERRVMSSPEWDARKTRLGTENTPVPAKCAREHQRPNAEGDWCGFCRGALLRHPGEDTC